MIQSGSVAFTHPDEYEAAIGALGISAKLVLTGSTDFKARLTWLKLRHLHLASGRESVPRIACLSLQPARAFVSFAVAKQTPIVWSGLELRLGDIAFHARGERTHQRTSQPEQLGHDFPAAHAARLLQQSADRRASQRSAGRAEPSTADNSGSTPGGPSC